MPPAFAHDVVASANTHMTSWRRMCFASARGEPRPAVWLSLAVETAVAQRLFVVLARVEIAQRPKIGIRRHLVLADAARSDRIEEKRRPEAIVREQALDMRK